MYSALTLVRPHVTHTGSGEAPGGLGLLLGIGIPILVLSILGITFYFVRKAVARQMAETRAAATSEGIVLDSGPVWITIHYRGYRSSNLAIGVGLTKTRATAILTRQRLILTPASRHYFNVARSDLGKFQVGVADGSVFLRTEDPPHGSGSIDFRIPVPDASAWVTALTEAGARPA
jgi:hypothetical protein